jgi:hypothetical protein
MDRAEIKALAAEQRQAAKSLPVHTDTLKRFQDIERCLRLLRRVCEDQTADEVYRMMARHGYQAILKDMREMRELMEHKAALLFKMERDGETDEMKAELARVDQEFMAFSSRLEQSMKKTVVKKPSKLILPTNLSGEHWAKLSQKERLRKALE